LLHSDVVELTTDVKTSMTLKYDETIEARYRTRKLYAGEHFRIGSLGLKIVDA